MTDTGIYITGYAAWIIAAFLLAFLLVFCSIGQGYLNRTQEFEREKRKNEHLQERIFILNEEKRHLKCENTMLKNREEEKTVGEKVVIKNGM